jgi:hypothetical protein
MNSYTYDVNISMRNYYNDIYLNELYAYYSMIYFILSNTYEQNRLIEKKDFKVLKNYINLRGISIFKKIEYIDPYISIPSEKKINNIINKCSRYIIEKI